ncbi:HAD-IIIC family phosphatase [Paenibacillus pinihumi]|uniref:HAD-IIIC family phosphatase n=1 Tax=Paenibacillus pinihumi TaxID=669462 RepID=UPI00048C8E38|nr:HAD-IIIC family phosphatase [Paenibacillus pinihumi]
MNKEIKCIIWDLDNTLWDGVLLENDDISLKPGIVEIIRELDTRGILHSIASKNSFDYAIRKLEEFGISEYFLFPEINWDLKSISISNIQKSLNIGMDSILFIDDQIFERDEVKYAHPDITCMDALEYESLLNNSRLQHKYITRDAQRRRLMYMEDKQRREDEERFNGAPENFLASLDMTFVISEAQEEDLIRAIELTERTHQLNTTGYTYGYDELNNYRTSDDHKLLVCELTDRYGSYGKIGLALLEIKESALHLKLLLMSCRVMSRGVGTILLSYIMQMAKSQNKILLADFKKTDRNKVMYVTYKFANFKEVSTNEEGITVLENDLSMVQKFPHYVNVEIK